MARSKFRRSPALLVWSVALAFQPVLAAAQDAVDPAAQPTVEEQIVVTANRLETPAEEVGSAVTVITAEEIALLNKTTVGELLRTVPGLEVVRGGGPGQVTSVFLRGGSSSQTLVLVDGVRFNAPATGAFDFAGLTPDNVERIEIVRGPQSTLYGSEAAAGVINVISKRGREGFHVDGLVEAGELDHRRWRLGVDGGNGRFDYAVSVSDESTDGVSVAQERAGNTEKDPYDNTAATARFGWTLGDDGRLDASLRWFDNTVGNDGFDFVLGPIDDLNRIQDREALIGSVSLRQELGPRWTQSVAVELSDDELSGFDPDDAFSTFTVDSRTASLSAQSDVALTPSDTLSLGASYEERRANYVDTFDEKVDLASLFVQNAWSWRERLYLTAGARYDDHSSFGGETTWRLSASWGLGPDADPAATRLHASYGTGFKAPTLNDLFFPGFNNPELAPETSEGYDVGVEQTFFDGRLRLDVTWFDTEFEDLITFDFTTLMPQNIASAESSGIEATLELRPAESFHVVASHFYNDTENLSSGAQLARRPRNRSTLSLYFRPLAALQGAATLVAVSDRIDSDGATMDDYERVDLSLRYRFSDHFAPFVRVENLFDEDYEEINGFTTPGRVAVVGVGFGL